MSDVTMPQLGETVTEGTITKWFKQVGDEVKADEPLFEVSTDKVDTEVPSPVAGVLQEIKAQEGDTVEVGAIIAVVGSDASGAPGPVAQPAESGPSPVAESGPGPVGGAPPAASADASAPGAPPAAATRPAEAAPPAGGTAPAPPLEPPAAAPPPPPPPPSPPAAEQPDAASASSAPAAPSSVPPSSGDNRLLSPVVRRLVNEHGLDPGQITGTGPGGRITRDDVVNHIEHGGQTAPAPAAAAPPPPAPAPAPAPASAAAPAAAPAPAAPAPAPAAAVPAPPAAQAGVRDEAIRLSKIRTLTGDHMRMSLATSPHAFSVVEVDYASVDRVRDAIKNEWKQAEGFSLTYLPFISRSVVDAIADFPHMNASVGDGQLIVHRYVDLGIAVDLNYQGLIVPIVREADTKRLRAIAREISDLANRAKSRKLSPDDITGGTFTISNNGSAGSVLTAAIINQPQVAILSTDAIKRRPVAVDLPGGQEGIAIHSVGNLAMSWDHRAFDGAYAANFLVRIKDILETRDWEAEL
jgi:pyruvate dehydrogenase E2 component (dihydrolipoyllysine-residue acetyltransferase)